jgi:hypothetical protein
MHVATGKMFRIANDSPHFRHESLNLFATPAKDLTYWIKRKAIQTQIHVQANKLPLPLTSSILWPFTQRDGKHFMDNVLKACFSGRVPHDSVGDVESSSNSVTSVIE